MKRNDAVVNSVGNSLGSSKRLGMRDRMQRNENSNDLVVFIRSFAAVWQPIIDVIHSEMTFILLFQFDSDGRGAQRRNAARFLPAARSARRPTRKCRSATRDFLRGLLRLRRARGISHSYERVKRLDKRFQFATFSEITSQLNNNFIFWLFPGSGRLHSRPITIKTAAKNFLFMKSS